MKYRLEKGTSVYILMIFISSHSIHAMSHTLKSSRKNSITLACQDGDVDISRTLVYLLPVIKNVLDDMNTDRVPLMFNKYEVQTILYATVQIDALLKRMETETKEKYNIAKKYTPDDIPLHIRRIIKELMASGTPHHYASLLDCANYMLADYLVNALAGEWVLKKFKFEHDTLISEDVMTYIKKHRDYLQDTIYYECSIADLLLTSRNHRNFTAFETEITKVQDVCTLPLIFPIKEYLSEPSTGNGVITSLVGWEFMNKKGAEYPKNLTIAIKKMEKVVPMIMDTKFYDVDETDSSEEEELITTKPHIAIAIPTLKSYTFLGLTGLTCIKLNNLGISTIENDAFAALPKLQEIELKNNNLTTFPTIGLEKQLKKINLDGNKLFPGECNRLETRFGKDITCR